MTLRWCLLCGRPLPPARGLWSWLFPRPPLCKSGVTCRTPR